MKDCKATNASDDQKGGGGTKQRKGEIHTQMHKRDGGRKNKGRGEQKERGRREERARMEEGERGRGKNEREAKRKGGGERKRENERVNESWTMRLEVVGATNMQANSFEIEPFSAHWEGKGE